VVGVAEARWLRTKALLSRALIVLIFARFALRGLVRVTWNTVSDAIDQGAYLQLGLFMREGHAYTDGNRSPLYPAILSLFARREWAYFTDAKLLSLLLGLAALILIFCLARRMFGASAALATILLVSTNESFQMEASWVRCEVLLIPLFFLSWYLIAEGFRDRRLWLWGAVAAGLCQLTKGNGHLLVVAFLAGGLLSLGRSFVRQKWAYLFLATYLLTISPLLVVNALSFGDPFYNYNTTHALWLDRWEDTYAIGSPPPTMGSYLQSHSVSEMWQRQLYGIRRVILDGSSTLFPYFLQEQEHRALAVGISALIVCGGVLVGWLCVSRDRARRQRFHGTLAFTAVLFALFFLLFAWYAQVISKPRFFVPLVPVVYAGGLGAVSGLSRIQWASRRAIRRVARAHYVIFGVTAAAWLLYSAMMTALPLGQGSAQLRDPFAVDLEASRPREDVLNWLVEWTRPGEAVLWGPSHYLPRWKYTPRLEFVPIPIDLESWEELEDYVHRRGITYWVLDFATIGRRNDLLGPTFDRHFEQIVFKQLPPRWELVHADRQFIFDYCIYRVYPEGETSPPVSPVPDVAIGPQVQLLGYRLSPEKSPSGQAIDLALHWSALSPVDGDYKVFTHLLGPDGTLQSQHDGQPLYGFWPTVAWAPGQTIVDHHHLSISDDATPGAYHIAVGLYDGTTMERLPVMDLNTGLARGDHVILPAIVRVEG
jgi:hypothetical protein